MRAFNFATLNTKKLVKSIAIYFLIYYGVTLLGFFIATQFSDTEVSINTSIFSGIMIYLFIIGCLQFVEGFKFSQAVNMTRSEFWKGTVLSSMMISVICSLVEFVSRIVFGLFHIVHTTLFTSLYGEASRTLNSIEGYQMMDVKTAGTMFLLNIFFFMLIFLLGVFIAQCYYRTGKYMRIGISLLPLAIVLLLYQLVPNIGVKALEFIDQVLGITAQQPWRGVLSFAILVAGFAVLARLMMIRLSLHTK